MTTEHTDRDRPALSAAALTQALARPGGLWRAITVTAQTASTNADLLAEAGGGAPEGLVLVADAQTAGRGRLGRRWVSPPRAALMFSVLLRPSAVPAGRRGWLALLAGVAVVNGVRGSQEARRLGPVKGTFSGTQPPQGHLHMPPPWGAAPQDPPWRDQGTAVAAAVDARLKWPNDVLVGDRKLAGILAEQSGSAIVVGIGINVSTRRDELPVPGATSLLVEGAARADRDLVLRGVLAEFEYWYQAWVADPGSGRLRGEYLRLCATLGRAVRVDLPGGRVISGTASDVDPDGRLVVRTAAGPIAVSAGDVVHVR